MTCGRVKLLGVGFQDRTLTLHNELAAFYERNGFGPVLGSRPRTVPVFTGCLLVPLPNIDARRRYLKYHDLHHLVTGYTVGRIGEGGFIAGPAVVLRLIADVTSGASVVQALKPKKRADLY